MNKEDKTFKQCDFCSLRLPNISKTQEGKNICEPCDRITQEDRIIEAETEDLLLKEHEKTNI